MHLIVLSLTISLSLTTCADNSKATPTSEPHLDPVSPFGMTRGTTLELTLTGAGLIPPTGLWTSFPTSVSFPAESGNQADSKKLRVRLEVPKDVPLGLHGLRLATANGLSNLRLFCIDELPEVHQSNGNHDLAAAQPLTVPCVVAGLATADKSDFYKVAAKSGDRLTFDVLGRRLANAIDPQLTLLDPRTNKELAFSNDAPGLATDPRITHRFAEAGEYIIQVRDTQFRGGADYGYRLRIGDFPCATACLPMAVRRGQRTRVAFAGPNVDGASPVHLDAPSDAETVSATPRFANGLAGWPATVLITDIEDFLEVEPNNEAAQANRVPVSGAVTARFLEPNDVDCFTFTAEKGKRYVIRSWSQKLGSPAVLDLTLKDQAGKVILQADAATDARLDFQAANDGDFTLFAKHPLLWGGPEEVYRISIEPYRPGFELHLAANRITSPRGGVTLIPIADLVRHGFFGPIDVRISSPNGIEGSISIPATSQEKATKATSPMPTSKPDKETTDDDSAPPPVKPMPSKSSQVVSPLFVQADASVALGAYPIQIDGIALIDGKETHVRGDFRSAARQELSNLPQIPGCLNVATVAVTEKPPFTLRLTLNDAGQSSNDAATLTIDVDRQPGFSEEIALTAVGVPADLSVDLKTIFKTQTSAEAQVKCGPKAPWGRLRFSVTGKAKHDGREVVVLAPPVDWSRPPRAPRWLPVIGR